MKCAGLDKVLQDMNNGTFDFTKDGKCIGCGNCCSNILPMTDNEVEEIKVYMKIHKIKEQSHFAPYKKVPELDMVCPFMMNYGCKRCVIYEVRPKVCRDFTCNPKQRPIPDIEYSRKCKAIDVRNTFFGK